MSKGANLWQTSGSEIICQDKCGLHLNFVTLNLSLLNSKTYHLSYFIYKHDAIDIADPKSVQDQCYMNFVIDLTHRRVSVAQW